MDYIVPNPESRLGVLKSWYSREPSGSEEKYYQNLFIYQQIKNGNVGPEEFSKCLKIDGLKVFWPKFCQFSKTALHSSVTNWNHMHTILIVYNFRSLRLVSERTYIIYKHTMCALGIDSYKNLFGERTRIFVNSQAAIWKLK